MGLAALMVLVGALAAMGPARAQSADSPPTLVYVFRAMGGIFVTRDMDNLAALLEAQGSRVEVSIEYTPPAGTALQVWDYGVTATVTAGETLATVAGQFGVPAWLLADVNGIAADKALAAGQRIVIAGILIAHSVLISPSSNVSPLNEEVGEARKQRVTIHLHVVAGALARLLFEIARASTFVFHGGGLRSAAACSSMKGLHCGVVVEGGGVKVAGVAHREIGARFMAAF